MFKVHAKFDADSLLYLLSHFECDGQTVHILTQQCLLPPLTSTVSHHCSLMHVSVYSPWLPGYINVAQTILITLALARLFPDRPCMLSLNILNQNVRKLRACKHKNILMLRL